MCVSESVHNLATLGKHEGRHRWVELLTNGEKVSIYGIQTSAGESFITPARAHT